MISLRDMESNIELLPEQQKALEKLHSGAVLLGGTGSGKTYTSLFFYKQNYAHLPLYVITTARKRDEKDWEYEGNDVGVKPNIVDSWNNITKYSQVKHAFFIFDEQRAVGYGKWGKTFISIAKQNKWIMLSATPGDKWIDFMPIFVANGYYKHKTDFVKQHVEYNPYVNFPQIKKYHNVEKLQSIRNRIMVPMHVRSRTTQHHHYISLDGDLSVYNDIYKNRFSTRENRPIRNVSELMSELRRSINDHISRIECASFLISTIPKVIVFYNFDYELQILRDICNKFELTYSEWNGHNHDPIPDADEWVYLVQYTAGAEAWNCVETDTIIFYSLNYSYKIMKQAIGRIDRLNTKFVDLHYYYPYIQHSIDDVILKTIKNKKVFNQSTWAKKEGFIF